MIAGSFNESATANESFMVIALAAAGQQYEK
jgi:hypothetical protein